jgi:hypothetical protein
MYRVPGGYERHHIDGNPLNNDPSNILIVTRRGHQVLDGRMEVLKKGLRQITLARSGRCKIEKK